MEQTLTEETSQATPPATETAEDLHPVPIFLNPVLVKHLAAMNPA